jgi:hypothetical protein
MSTNKNTNKKPYSGEETQKNKSKKLLPIKKSQSFISKDSVSEIE